MFFPEPHSRVAGLSRAIVPAAVLVSLLFTGSGSGQEVLVQAESAASADRAVVAEPVDFVAQVLPIFQARCFSCHGPEKQKSDYRLDDRETALSGGAVVAGKSDQSQLLDYVSAADPAERMPPEGDPLTAEQIGILRAWIDQGADWPDSADVRLKDKADHWAYLPLQLPSVPRVKQSDWVRTPIDAFILSRLEEQHLTPSAPADRAALIRRVTFDLTGLPPTPAAIDAFLADGNPDAYLCLIDDLLKSPRYGERWARHWMDIVHFAETHGNDQDRPRPHAWPYRDYLIQSLNDDKPYARFIQEQLAGDVLFPDDPQAIVATGFLAAGPWDESSQLNIVDDTIDKKIARNLDRDDMLTTTMATFQSVTVHCARCHDHKFDPVTQEEYYRLQAVFAGVDRANRPYEPDVETARRRKVLLQEKADLAAARDAGSAALLAASVQADVAAWESAVAPGGSYWIPLDPLTFVSAEGATPQKQEDGSILFAGVTPATDTYTIVAHTSLSQISGVRLELLTDDSLPHRGPGRQENGNLHLSEFRVSAAPLTDPAASAVLELQNPAADFSQDGWTVAMAIDSKPETAWGIFPEVGKPHRAVFELKQKAGFDGGTVLTFVLEQKHGTGHLIGRLRLSVTVMPTPLPAPQGVDGSIERILATPAQQRTDTQKAELAAFVVGARITDQLAALPPQGMVYSGTTDFVAEGNFTPARGVRPIYLLTRGDVSQPDRLVTPAALACIAGLDGEFRLDRPDDEGARRAALAGWLSSPQNSLTWRSIVNRVWHYHFGRGIVDTPSDFGHMGSAPSHPELLDWLAATFRDGGGSLKSLHRLILTSAVYLQSSRHNPQFAEIDGGNRLLWRMNRTRLDAESVRDAVLQITGRLDTTMGGPSVKQFIQSPGIHVTPMVDYLSFNVDAPESYRRSVYRFLFRTLPDPFMDSLDCADPSQLTPTRNTSVTALQALAMLNNRFLVRQCEHFADRLQAMHEDSAAQIDAACRLALGRPATGDEITELSAYAARHGLANACRLILNSNEFMFVH